LKVRGVGNMDSETALLREEEAMFLAVLAYLAGAASHYLMPELAWLGKLFPLEDVLMALLVLLLGSALYYGYAGIVVSLAYGVHTAALYAPLVKVLGLLDILPSAVGGSTSLEQLQGAVPAQRVIITAVAALVVNLFLCISSSAFGVHLHARSKRAALALAVFAVSAYVGYSLGVLV